jgi:hypothetical protein
MSLFKPVGSVITVSQLALTVMTGNDSRPGKERKQRRRLRRMRKGARKTDMNQRRRRRLLSSPASCNEYNMLELPEAWEPQCSSRPPPNGEGKETHIGFPYRDLTM